MQKKSSPETDYPFWTRSLDNLPQLGSGVVDGQEVARDADGTLWTFALLFVKADEDVRANDFGLVHFGGRSEVCPECMANRDARPFTDMSAEAGWRPSEAMPLIAYQARMREPHHPLTDHAFFCHRYFFPIDMMHLLECKGVSGLVFGSVLLWLTRDSRLGGNRDERLAAINTLRLLHYRARPGEVVLPKIYQSNITRDGWENLSGPAYKAAITRHAAPLFRELVCL